MGHIGKRAKEGPSAGIVGNGRKEGSPCGRKTALRAHHSCQSGCDVCGHSLIYTLRRLGGGRCSCHVAMVARSVGGRVGLGGLAAGGVAGIRLPKTILSPPSNSSYPTLAGIPLDLFYCRSETELRTH